MASRTPKPSEAEPLLAAHQDHPAAAATDARRIQGPPTADAISSPAAAPPIPKILATLFSFSVLGLITSTPGVLLPHLEQHYGLNDASASLVFLVAPIGYLVGARLSAPIHRRLGRRGVAAVAPACQVLFTGSVVLFHGAPGGFALFLAATMVGTMGSGLVDGSWCAWAGGLGGSRTNTIQGLLHGSFSIGAGLGPFLAGTMLSVWGWPWWTWYGVLLGAAVAQGVFLFLAFRSEDGARYSAGLKTTDYTHDDANSPAETASFLHHRVTWLCALYFVTYVGTEAAISGWIVTFMLRARHASPYHASLTATCFWFGMTLGRVVLGPVTDRMRVRTAAACYLAIAIALQAGLRLTGTGHVLAVAGSQEPEAEQALVVSTALIAGIGVFLGPLYPSGVVVLSRALPRECLVAAMSFVASVGQLGGAALPFALGALAQRWGIEVFQGFILGLLGATLLVWLVLASSGD